MISRAKVSVLVPIYNVDVFLSECLDSLVNQTLKEIEIICINDGSTDNSLEIIKDYAENDKRIVVINKKNSGYGDSMNQGLKKATGEYVGIVESDDFIDLDAFEKMYKIAKSYDLDVVKSNYYEYYGDIKKDKAVSDMFPQDQLGRVVDPREERQIFYQPPCIWAAIYKNEFLKKNKIDFLPTPGASYQDTGFNFKVWAMARRTYFIKRAFLHYRQDNLNSSVKDSGKIYCVKDEYDSIEKFLEKHGLMEDLGAVMFTCRFGGYIWNMHRLERKAALEFADVIKKDLKRAKRLGYMNELDNVGERNSRMIAIRYPRLYVYVRPLHDLRNKIRPALSGVARAVLPRYGQRLRTMDALERLQEAQNELTVKVAKIKSNVEKGKEDEE